MNKALFAIEKELNYTRQCPYHIEIMKFLSQKVCLHDGIADQLSAVRTMHTLHQLKHSLAIVSTPSCLLKSPLQSR